MTVDYLIVGQGLCGSLLIHELIDRDKSFCVIDPNPSNSSSRVAAGIINPITGRSYVKSWMYDTLLEFLLERYQQISQRIGKEILTQRSIVRTLEDVKSENNWHSRSGDENYTEFMDHFEISKAQESLFEKSLAYGLIKKAFQLNLNSLLDGTRAILQDDQIISEYFEYEKLRIKSDHLDYKNLRAGKVIYCEGSQILNNPWFNSLDFRPSKGEILLVRIPKFDFPHQLRHQFFIAHYRDDLYWIGASYINNFKHLKNTPSEYFKLTDWLDDYLQCDYEVVQHLSGVRPATKHRRPMIGQHPEYSQMFVLNGMGAKGSSLAPYWTRQLVLSLEEGQKLGDEVKLVFQSH